MFTQFRRIAEFGEVEMVALAGPLQVDAAVLQPFTVQAIAEAYAVQQRDGRAFQDAGADAGFHVLAGPGSR
jgi:hypothetical protein